MCFLYLLFTGLSVCGTGFGTFIFGPLNSYLLKHFKWQGTLLILAGIFLNIICFALLIRDLDLDSDSDSDDSSSEEDSTSDIESNMIDSEVNSIADENDAKSDNESEFEHRNHLKSSAMSSIKGGNHNSSNESLASVQKRITFNKTARMRSGFSECEPEVELLPRTCASLINIPTYIKNSSSKANNHNNNSSSNLSNSDSIGELTFRRGGYLHNLITYYPHLLSLFLPWNLECKANDLTVNAVVLRSKSPEKSTTAPATASTTEGSSTKPTSETPSEVQNTEEDRKAHLQVDFITPPPSLRSSENDLSHHQDSFAIPVPTPNYSNYPEFNFRPSRVGGARGLVGRGGRHRHRLHQNHHLNHDLFGNYLHNLRLQRGSLTYRSAMLIISKYKLKASSAPDIYKTSMATINEDKV